MVADLVVTRPSPESAEAIAELLNDLRRSTTGRQSSPRRRWRTGSGFPTYTSG